MPLIRLGGFSYSLYLIHAPLLLVLPQIFRHFSLDVNGRNGGVIMALLVCPLIVLCAYGFYLVVERPFLTRRTGRDVPQLPARTIYENAG